jgi:hypothetical protein
MASTSPSLSALDVRLLDWLENDSDRFEKYITKHPEVADRVEHLLDLGVEWRTTMTDALTHAVAAPIDLAERLTASIGKDRSTDAASVALDLFGVGPRTIQLFLAE